MENQKRNGRLSFVRGLFCAGAVFIACASALAQGAAKERNPNTDLIAEFGSVKWQAGEGVLDAGGSNPAREVASTLRRCLGLAVSSEQPFQMYLGDLLDTTDPAWVRQHPEPSARSYNGKPAKVHVSFRTRPDGSAEDPESLLRSVAEQLNGQQPYDFQLQVVHRPQLTMYALVPHATHDASGQLIHPEPYMDTRVTLLEQQVSIADFAVQMTNQLTVRTGHHFSCCEAAVFGVPWGIKTLHYGPVSKPAREILADLMEAAGHVQAYSASCEAHSTEFCFIQVASARPAPHEVGDVCTGP